MEEHSNSKEERIACANDIIGRIINDLNKSRAELRSFCHSDQCFHPFQCPQHHEKCKDKLNTVTAIAWTTADYIDYLADILTDPEDLTYDSFIKSVEECKGQIKGFQLVLSYHEKESAHELIIRAHNCIRVILNRMADFKKDGVLEEMFKG